ncbi:MAG: hypothetical protein ER33_14370 [Cyanobium sp. CACIAM 14]|nr:MAG: hypothetical protein ER33_14370 [Cyanobium sp. CACIAM 14]
MLVGFAATALLSQALPARAFEVTVDGETYDITAEVTSYAASPARFDLIANGGAMPWWGNSDLASRFAAAVGNSLGNNPPSDEFGPLFAFQLAQVGMDDIVDTWTQLIVPPGNSQLNYQPLLSETWRYAVATRVVTPPPSPAVPGPLPILGVSVCFGYARRIRRRQRASLRMDG